MLNLKYLRLFTLNILKVCEVGGSCDGEYEDVAP
jgi:hypothetical protein